MITILPTVSLASCRAVFFYYYLKYLPSSILDKLPTLKLTQPVSSTPLRFWYVTKFMTRSSAVAAIADRTAYDVRYSYRPLSRIAAVSTSRIYVFTVSNWSLLLIPVSVYSDRCFLSAFSPWTRVSLRAVWAVFIVWLTRQHSNRKEDRAMRPIYGCT